MLLDDALPQQTHLRHKPSGAGTLACANSPQSPHPHDFSTSQRRRTNSKPPHESPRKRKGNQSASGGSCTAAPLSFTGLKGGNRADQFTYDAAGDVTNDTTNCYSYDAEGRISAVYQLNCSTLIASYVYDAEGRRVQKTTGGVTLNYLYDIAGHQIAEISSSGAWNRGEIYAGARHLGTYNNGTTFFNHEDWLGTERARSNVTGVVCETITSLPYGDGQNTAGTCGDESPMHFTGKMRDTESSLDDFDARYYSSQWGRFMISDWDAKPVDVPYAKFGDPQTLNLYSYVRNNPSTSRDPDGHDTIREIGPHGEVNPTPPMSSTEKQVDIAIVEGAAAVATYGASVELAAAGHAVRAALAAISSAGTFVSATTRLTAAASGQASSPVVEQATTAVTTVTNPAGAATLVATGGNMEAASTVADIASVATLKPSNVKKDPASAALTVGNLVSDVKSFFGHYKAPPPPPKPKPPEPPHP